MSLRRTTEPASLPIELSEARKQCEIGEGDTTHDSHLLRLIRTATNDVERGTRRALITQTWQLRIAKFWPVLEIPRPPLQSVVIQYVNDSGTLTTLQSTEYQIDFNTPASIVPAYAKTWPSTRPETVAAVQIQFVAGYGNLPSDVPQEFQNLILELVAFRFFNRGDEQMDIPKHIQWAMKSLHCGAKYGYYEVR